MRTLTIVLATAALSFFAASFPHAAEPCEIVVVKSAELKPYQDVLQGFRDFCNCEVRELRPRAGEGEETTLLRSADAVVAIGTTVFKKVRTIQDRPVIYVMVMPSEAALSLQPNISGVSMDISPETYISTMMEVFPKARRIGLLYDPQHTAVFVGEAAKAARAAGIELVEKQVRDPHKIPSLLDEMAGKIDIFWMMPDSTVVTAETVDYLLRFSFQHSVPIFSFSKKYVEMGAVAALDVDPYDMGVQAAEIANASLTGRKSAIRVYARTSHLTINKNVAAKMGLAIRDETTKKVKKGE